MACDESDVVRGDAPDTAIALVDRLKNELCRFKKKCCRLEEENRDLRENVDELQLKLFQLTKPSPVDQTACCSTATSAASAETGQPAQEQHDAIKCCPENAPENFQFDHGLGVYVNRHNGMMYDGSIYFYFDKKIGQHLFYNNEKQCYEKLSTRQHDAAAGASTSDMTCMENKIADNPRILADEKLLEIEEGEISDGSDIACVEAPLLNNYKPSRIHLKRNADAAVDADHEFKKDLLRPIMRLIVVETLGDKSFDEPKCDKSFSTCRPGFVFFVPGDKFTRVIGRRPSTVSTRASANASSSAVNTILDISLDEDEQVLPRHATLHFDENMWKFVLTDTSGSSPDAAHIQTTCQPRIRTTQIADEEDDDDDDVVCDDDGIQYIVAHAGTICIGGTRMLVHIHVGYDECDECHSGNAFEKYSRITDQSVDVFSATPSVSDIKRKYGLRRKDANFCAGGDYSDNYSDRARARRRCAGSDDDAAHSAVQPASLGTPISCENKGHAMLVKMGWKGGSIGAETNNNNNNKTSINNNRRLLEPLPVLMRPLETAGLGFADSVNLSTTTSSHVSFKTAGIEKLKRSAKMRLRYEQLERQTLIPSSSTNFYADAGAAHARGKIVYSKEPVLNWVKGSTMRET